MEECRQILNLLQPLAEAKEITLETDFAPELPTLKADPLLFPRVLQNLLENAIKYSPARSKVRLEIQAEDSAIRFTVRDQGPGIAASDLPHLFEIFYRGQQEGDTQGFGLGLATVKRILMAMAAASGWKRFPAAAAPSFLHFPLRPKVLGDSSHP